MFRKLLKMAVALILIALVWKVLTGDEEQEVPEVDKIE